MHMYMYILVHIAANLNREKARPRRSNKQTHQSRDELHEKSITWHKPPPKILHSCSLAVNTHAVAPLVHSLPLMTIIFFAPSMLFGLFLLSLICEHPASWWLCVVQADDNKQANRLTVSFYFIYLFHSCFTQRFSRFPISHPWYVCVHSCM